MTVARKPGHRGERGVSRKPLRREGRDASAEPVCSCAFFCACLHTRPRVQRAPGFPCALLLLSRAAIDAKLGRIAPRDREAVSADTRCLKIESADIYRARMRHIPPRGHRPARPGDPVFQSANDKAQRRCVLDTPLEPVIGLAEGETRWRSMTAYYRAAQGVTTNPTSSHPPSRHPETPPPRG